ncbi:hypothetical protein TRIUR3_10337 [Triticum urartu]|uniref:Uncharacterized protein n=1 Tax=Triticum urartu TaxID=4572 RepID=M7YE62_TRIUA|nr:hypothetical protein TRIUR3_10337 [Triticum urartu]
MAEWYMASWKLSVSTIRARSCRAFSSVRPPTNALPLASLGGYRRADPPGAHGARGGSGAGPESRSRRWAGGEGDGGCRRCHVH